MNVVCKEPARRRRRRCTAGRDDERRAAPKGAACRRSRRSRGTAAGPSPTAGRSPLPNPPLRLTLVSPATHSAPILPCGVAGRAPREGVGRDERSDWVGAEHLEEDVPTPPTEPCLRLSPHTALHSRTLPPRMSRDVARLAQDSCLAQARHATLKADRSVLNVLEPANVMHLERAIPISTSLA
jgi:hypothetical protein